MNFWVVCSLSVSFTEFSSSQNFRTEVFPDNLQTKYFFLIFDSDNYNVT